jgi:hypothetical protein
MPARLLVAAALFTVPPLLGVVLARFRRAGNLVAPLRLRAVDALVPLGLAVQVVGVVPRATALALGYVVLIAWAAIRAALTTGPARLAFSTLLLGGLLNAVPILLNGAMPYSPSAGHVAEGVKGVRIDDHTLLPMLGDVIPLPAGKFMSVGDIVLALGTVLTVSLVLQASPRVARMAAHATPRGT